MTTCARLDGELCAEFASGWIETLANHKVANKKLSLFVFMLLSDVPKTLVHTSL
jgi:hypothetical protein